MTSNNFNIAIIDYGSGNLRSVAKAFEQACAEAGGGEFHERAGGMTEAVLLSVLAE